jgi:hypothetical protein
MRKGLLVMGTEESINIGDYIQAMAASQFLDEVDVYIEREKLKEYEGYPVKLIMNGWFMHHPENWPPSSYINPLFISFHINSTVKEFLLDSESISYLKKHEPIGCRDIGTMNLLKKNNIEAYFSGCLTLTLGKKYLNLNKEDKIYIVDPLLNHKWNLKSLLNALYIFLFSHRKVMTIVYKYYIFKKITLKDCLKISRFLKIYSEIFDEEILINAEYIHHESNWMKNTYNSNYKRLQYADFLIKSYSKAKLVITSRIHCALPCLGMQTKVVYLNDVQSEETSFCRLDGLLNLFNVVNYNGIYLIKKFEHLGLINDGNVPKNKREYLQYIEPLQNKCFHFFN